MLLSFTSLPGIASGDTDVLKAGEKDLAAVESAVIAVSSVILDFRLATRAML
jgi:hypothetical protein